MFEKNTHFVAQAVRGLSRASKRLAASAAIGALLVGSAATPSLAASTSSITIIAHVDVFCRIGTPVNPLTVVNGSGDLGSIQQICNTQGGSQVTAQFANLSGGTVEVGGQSATIDANGTAVITANGPLVQTADWQVQGAQPVDPDAPVTVELSIAPK